MLLTLAKRMLFETDRRLLWKFAWNFGVQSLRAHARFKRDLRRGRTYPAFLFISITNACNLRCQGCWVSVEAPQTFLAPETFERILHESRRRGNRFFGILGGEPLLHPDLWTVLKRFPDCYFQLFTNGTLITDETAETMRRLGNVTPLVSIEGLEEVSDERRGGKEVFRQTLEGLERCRRAGLVLGVATSICRSNIDDLVSERFVRQVVDHGAHYLWYYIYRPAGRDPRPELALSSEQVLRLRRFIVEMRGRAPLAIIDAYWDEAGRALCPAASGIACHINPWSDIEPCPPVQFAAESVHTNGDLYRTIGHSAFLDRFRRTVAETTPGCILLERPDVLRRLIVEEGARDSTGRGTGLAELEARACCASHHMPGHEIPEAHWFYRFAKRHWYFGFGGYA